MSGKVDPLVMSEPKKASDEQLKANIENMEAEVKQYGVKKEHVEYLIDANEGRLKLITQLHKISEEKNRKLQPTFEYEGDPDFIKHERELKKINNESERRKMQMDIDNLKLQLEGVMSELKRFEEALPVLKAELKKRGK